MRAIRRLLVLLAALVPLTMSAPAAAQTYDQLFATCRSYDVPAAQAAAACQTLGNETRKGENEPGKVIDWPKALWFHDRACSLGDPYGCVATGFLYAAGKVGATGNPPKPSLQGAFTYYQRACELSAETCFVVAAAHERGGATAKNLALADSLYARACSADKSSCGYWADFMLRRSDVKPDPARVAELYRSACVAGREARACSSLAALIEQGKVAPATPDEANKLRLSACAIDKAQCKGGTTLAAAKPTAAPPGAPKPAPVAAAKPAPAPAPAAKPAEKPDPLEVCNKSTDKLAAAEACELLGTAFGMNISDGEGADHEASGRFFHRACSLGLGSGCKNLGTKFLFGEIGKIGNPPVPNHKLAAVYFRKACDLDPMECTWLGLSYERGEGVAMDVAEAQRLYNKSCAAKDGSGCYYAAKIMEDRGNGTPAQIFQLYAQGCDLDDTGACAEASKRHERGIGTKVNKAKAAALREKACANDYFKSLEAGFCPKEPAETPAKPKPKA